MIININCQGDAKALWSDKINLNSLGDVQVFRASMVEFNNATKHWEVTFQGRTHPSFSNPSREVCLAWERSVLEESLKP